MGDFPCQVQQIRRADVSLHGESKGYVWNTAPKPKPTATTSTKKPQVMPSIWGIVRLKPKFTPDASNMVLFGLGRD